jgi:sugar lactone lactonase YvrE
MRYYDGDLYWWTKGDTAAAAGGSNGLWKAAVPAEGDTISIASSTQILSNDDYTPSGLAIDGMGNTYLMAGWNADTTVTTSELVRVTPAGTVESIYTLPTENPNKAVWHDNKLYVAAGNQGNQIYVIYLGPDYATGAVPQY